MQGQFGNRTRNSNLISIPTIGSDDSEITKPSAQAVTAVPKLIRPQDRYCNTSLEPETKSSEPTTKFNRYDNSDKSDSESDTDLESVTSDGGTKKLKRADSLEALMEALQNEIEGDSKPKVEERVIKPKVKKTKKSKAEPTSADNVVEQKESVAVEDESQSHCQSEKDKTENIEVPKENTSNAVELKNLSKSTKRVRHPRRPLNENPHSFMHKSNPLLRPHGRRTAFYEPIGLPLLNQNLPLTAQPPPYFINSGPIANPMMHMQPHMPYIHPNISLAPGGHMPFGSMRYERALSPLTLNTDLLSTTITAPLSPRSAAFVLQNREIIERRKRSPRRSYSRSPSPRFRRSKSPRRSSVSPGRSPASPRFRFSPKSSRSRLSPGRRRLSPGSKRSSPIERVSPKQQEKLSPAAKASVYDRLGARVGEKMDPAVLPRKQRSRSVSLSLSPSPERVKQQVSRENSEAEMDPILEARKRKFETNEITMKEGVIRLKPKDETEIKPQDAEIPEVKTTVQNDEDLEIDLDLLDVTVDELFSDEETDDENEGRFKARPQQTAKVPILSFTQLLKGTNTGVKNNTLSVDRQRIKRDRSRNHKKYDRDVNNGRSRSPLHKRDSKLHNTNVDKTVRKPEGRSNSQGPLRDRVVLKAEKIKHSAVPTLVEKKIEIKIRNPTKYEPKHELHKEVERMQNEPKDKTIRKVEVGPLIEKDQDVSDDGPEIIVDNEDGEDIFNLNEGKCVLISSE